MTIGEKLKEKARDITDALKQQYRQHIGEELAEKAQSLTDRGTSLDRREKDISEREKRLAKYYLIPRIYIQLPVFAAVCVGAYFAYNAVQPLWPESGSDAAPSVSDFSESSATGVEALIAGSDDFGLHEAAFVKATQTLLNDGSCTKGDFKEMGGWYKSTTHPGSVYFTYCGGMQQSNKIYLDASNGRIF